MLLLPAPLKTMHLRTIITPLNATLVPASIAFPAAGFTTAGVAKGSLAAGIRGLVGNVAAGSLFASFMSFGATNAALKDGAGGGVLALARQTHVV